MGNSIAPKGAEGVDSKCDHEFVRPQTAGDPPGPLGDPICVKCGKKGRISLDLAMQLLGESRQNHQRRPLPGGQKEQGLQEPKEKPQRKLICE